jgi:hypothetical protein
MSVAQFRDYCNAFAFKSLDTITKNDKIVETALKKFGTFFASGRSWYYTKNKKAFKKLLENKNIYAIKEREKNDNLQGENR